MKKLLILLTLALIPYSVQAFPNKNEIETDFNDRDNIHISKTFVEFIRGRTKDGTLYYQGVENGYTIFIFGTENGVLNSKCVVGKNESDSEINTEIREDKSGWIIFFFEKGRVYFNENQFCGFFGIYGDNR